ncbi:ALBINO3-like protein 2, chloroplastic [Gastrolobium bilobum]|uniref:ALBINO3-like protein 2, chloroplastic n=1 Tax=Gastrolobium bilobum TaxID=150636 RepID=UPI002AB2BC50|nr:ALBINO3-like protein 2, chloroplastic [Gastrolobium bilobum]
MATVAALFSHLRRSRQSSSLSLSLLSLPRVLTSHHPPPLPASATPHSPTLPFFGAFRSRAFSTRFSSDDRESVMDSLGVDSPVNSELLKVIADSSGGGEDNPVFPVRAVIWMLDSFHDLSGFPWWITIVSSTLALRIVLLFPLVLTLHKVKRIGEFFPKLPPPFPPPFSGKSYIRQFIFFQKERKAVGCPSYVWPLVPIIVQIPCFFLWMISIRKMSLDGHPGFNCGGALWFQNLTELSHGYSGFIFPFLIAGLHYVNVQISFRKPLVEETRNIFDLLAKYYKRYLDFLTLPIVYIGFCIPQGSLLYWITNSSLTLVQHVALRHPAVLAKLGLQDKNSQTAASEEIGVAKTSPSLGLQDSSPTAATKETVSPEKNPLDSPEKWHKIPIEDMSPKELTALSIPFLSDDDKESAIPLLKLALDKDPEYVRALVLMGRVLLLKHINDEANEYFERAISKLSLAGHPTDAEDVDLLILSSQWAGVACERQGKRAEGRAHFERVANMEEPEDPTSKGYYFDGLLLLASTLFDAGHKAEAAKYLRLVVAYKPGYKKFLEQCERDDDDDADADDIASDLARSRREL